MTTTPPRAVLPPERDQNLKNTPWSAGSASHESYQTQITQEHYKPYLAADIASAIAIPFKDFLHFAFAFDFDIPKDANWREKEPAFRAIAKSQRCQTLLSKYQDEVGHETERYHTFNNLANHIIAELDKRYPRQGKSIVICRNDHVSVEGSSARRIPDCVVVPQSAMGHGERTSWDNLSKDGPTDNPFHWCELLAFVEFKLEKRLLHVLPSASSTEAASAAAAHHRGRATGSSSPRTSGSSKVKRSSGQSSNRESSKGRNRASATNSTSTSRSTIASAVSPSLAPPFPHSPHTSAGSKSTSSQKRKGPDLPIPSQKRRRKDEDTPMSRQDVLVQCVSYALEMLSHGGLRSHVFGALITDNILELLYYDRSLPVQSEPVCFLENPAALVAFLYCMQQLTFSRWGHVIAMEGYTPPLDIKSTRRGTPPSPSVLAALNPLREAQLKLNDGTILELGDLIFRQHALIGRGTCVIRASVKVPESNDPWPGKSLIVKFGFTPNTRTREGEILSDAIDLANSNNEHRWVLDHLPEVLHYEAFPTDATDVQTRLSEYLYLKKPNIYENRVLQVLVMTELFPITELTTTDTLAPVIRDVFRCYRWLYEEANVIHRDISLNNIMFRKKADNSLCGVLSDYDLSLSVTREITGPTSKQRTGTKPYMAIDLLQHPPPTHLYRHDLESLFYVIVVLTSRYHKGRETNENPPLQAWFDLGAEALAKEKKVFLIDPAPQPTPDFKKITLWIRRMKGMFREGFLARMKHEEAIGEAEVTPSGKQNIPDFDESTLGGHVDFDKFAQIVDLHIKE